MNHHNAIGSHGNNRPAAVRLDNNKHNLSAATSTGRGRVGGGGVGGKTRSPFVDADEDYHFASGGEDSSPDSRPAHRHRRRNSSTTSSNQHQARQQQQHQFVGDSYNYPQRRSSFQQTQEQQQRQQPRPRNERRTSFQDIPAGPPSPQQHYRYNDADLDIVSKDDRRRQQQHDYQSAPPSSQQYQQQQFNSYSPTPLDRRRDSVSGGGGGGVPSRKMGSVGPPFPSGFINDVQQKHQHNQHQQRGFSHGTDGNLSSREMSPQQHLFNNSYNNNNAEHRQQQHQEQYQGGYPAANAATTPLQQQANTSAATKKSHSIGTGSSPPPQGYMHTPRGATMGGVAGGGPSSSEVDVSVTRQQRRRSSQEGQRYREEEEHAAQQRAAQHQYQVEGTVIGADGRVTFQPNNVGTESSPPRDHRAEREEKAKVRWAWSVDRAGRVSKPLMNSIANGPLKSELHEIVRLLSSNTVDVQTTLQPSYTAELAGRGDITEEGVDDGANVPNIVTDHLRSIGTQNGLGLSKVNASMQVVEGDIASTAPTAQLDYNKLVLMQQGQQDSEQQELLARALDVQGSGGAFDSSANRGVSTYVKGVKTGGDGMQEVGVGGGGVPESLHHVVQRAPDGTLRVVSNNTSAHFPYCGIPTNEFPVLMAEARRQGVANQYGYISMPTQPFSLPPRRKVRAIQPVDYPHLYGSHNLHIDEQSSTQLSRAYTLWTQCTGFVPKF